MTVKAKPVCQSENEVNIIKDKITISTSKYDNNIKAFLQNRNKSTKEIIAKSCHESHRHLINLGNTKSVHEEKILTTEHKVTDKNNVLLSSKETWKSLVEDNSSQQRKSLEKCRKIRKNSKGKQIGAANRKPKLFLYSLSMLCVFFSIVKVKTVSCSEVIHWKLMTKPVYFGHDVDLKCIIKTKDTSEPMAWIRIPNGETIAYNEIATDVKKYGIAVQFDDIKMVYNLTIRQFNLIDLNRAYRCDYGFYSYTDKLLLNDKNFVSMPSDVKSTFTLAEQTLKGNMKIINCFPRPLCTGVFQGMNISEFMKISYTNVSIFFDTNIEIKYSSDTCQGFVNVTCTFGDSNLHFNEIVGDCSEKSNPKLTVVLIIIGIILGVTLGVFVLFRKRRQLSCCKLGMESHSDATNNDSRDSIAETGNDQREELENPTRNDSGIELSTSAFNVDHVRETSLVEF